MTDTKERAALKEIQSAFRDAGFYPGDIDGAWGELSRAALRAVIQAAGLRNEVDIPAVVPAAPAAPGGKPLAWGKKVSATFRDRVHWIAEDLQMPPGGADDLMSCMAFESDETFSPSIVNKAGSGATGLIQFMPATALSFFHTAAAIKAMTPAQKKANGIAACARLAAMTAEDQLNYVYRYFRPWKGMLKNIGDLYMAILWPAGVGMADTFVLWEKAKSPITYGQNAGLDANKDGKITRAEAVSKILQKVARGLTPAFRWPG